jgi:hypothetical protein
MTTIGPREFGALLGVSNAVVIALSFALFGPIENACDLVSCPWFVDARQPSFGTTALAVFMLAMPVGILWGIALGALARDIDGSAFARWIQITLIALMLATISGLPWHQVIAYSYAPTAIHTAILSWWVSRLARAADREVLRVRMREVEPGDRGGRVHRERLGQGDLVVRGVVE